MRAASLLAAAEDLARAAAARRPLEGDFHLGVIPTIAPFLVPPATERLKEAYPRLKLFLREDLTANLAERLAAGLLDAAVLALPYDLPGAETVDIGEDPFWFAAPAGHPLTKKKKLKLSDLANVDLLLLEDGHCLRDHAIEACHLRRSDSTAFGATSLFTLTQMAKSGLGATLLPAMAVKSGLAEAAALVAVPFSAPAPSRRIGIAWRKGSGRGEEAEAIARVLKEALAEIEKGADRPKAAGKPLKQAADA